MSVKIDEQGRRSVQVEVEVPGTPDEVWRAIATGPGVSSWFVPCEVDGREGGTVTCHFAPGITSTAAVTAWDPPRRFAATAAQDPGSKAPAMATEWIVEARSGGTCTVRVVHSLFASTDDWDDQLTSVEAGWPAFFRILRIYLESFRGEPSANVTAVSVVPGEELSVWDAFRGALGLEGASAGERCTTAGSGAPLFAGVVEPLAATAHGHNLMLRLDEPAPGIAFLGAFNCGGPVMTSLYLYLYGDRAAEIAARDEPRWRAWMSERVGASGKVNVIS
jgi:uncharacterized protein YndB with AHSA1/START domain